MTEALKLPYSVQGRGTVESIGNHFYRVCGPAGCTVVMVVIGVGTLMGTTATPVL